MSDQQNTTKPRASDSSTYLAALRNFSRSPHPYHRQNFELPHAAYKPVAPSPFARSSLGLRANTEVDGAVAGEAYAGRGEDAYIRNTSSDSGTEADDEHFLLGLPAPRSRPHKGLRGSSSVSISGTPSPILGPAILSNEDTRRGGYMRKIAQAERLEGEQDVEKAAERFRRKRRKVVMRRVMEVILLLGLGNIALFYHGASEALIWKKELVCQIGVVASLLVLYPLRLIYYLASKNNFDRWPSIGIPAAFDPAALLYPPLLTMFVTAILSNSNPGIFLPNIILSTSSLLPELIPSFANGEDGSTTHWFLSCLPLFVWDLERSPGHKSLLHVNNLDPEVLSLLYPLHQALCTTLRYLTTTSLLPAELQLLSIALINVLLLSVSPQAIILKSLLWGGGLSVFIICGPVLRWIVTLERVPKWRFRQAGNTKKKTMRSSTINSKKRGFRILRTINDILYGHGYSTVESEDDDMPSPTRKLHVPKMESNLNDAELKPQKRNALPNIARSFGKSSQYTPSGRRKRSASSSIQSFFHLTEAQAAVHKWLYAGYVYFCVFAIILVGIRSYIGKYALEGEEPIGWALAYMFGNLHWFRMRVLLWSLQNWIPLPMQPHPSDKSFCYQGWVQNLRHTTFGLANTRLVLSAYWLGIITVGLAIVLRLSAVVEVDTRRKVFHFMMVGMLLPATFVDPTFAAFALSLVLAVFLLLDLFRASQLPPLSKPIAYFLTPYVDGRDLRGPVVISHIFLLIGCAIPLWLALGALPREDHGWEVPTRDVSMVSGVICVGMGDAAASLFGRRWGKHKWPWTGGKSLEGSVAFAVAVGLGLVATKTWLRIGGWPDGGGHDGWVYVLGKSGVAAVLASLTEAVLTGGNDNVVVPVVFWLAVKGLGI